MDGTRQHQAIDSDEGLARLRLARTHGVGPVSYRQLLQRFGGPQAALDALPDLARRGGGKAVSIASKDLIAREIDRVRALGGHYLFWGDANYPPLLAELGNAPIALIAKGEVNLGNRKSVAVVGARNASAAACRFARTLALELGEAGFVVVSGLARGIDTSAHVGALATGTIAVIANGLDVVFPPENRELQERLARDHLLLSEHPPGTEPLARHFPHRNRIIAGLALGTVVVEAAPRSGSLLTARLATEAGREVMAVPGSPLDPRARGCNMLIREGATLVQSVDDIIEALGPMDQRMVRQSRAHFVTQAEWIFGEDDEAGDAGEYARDDARDDERARIVSLLGPVAVIVDELARQSSISTPKIQMILLELELAGRLQRHAGGRVSLIS